MNLLILIFAHLLADYPLQGDFLANFKGKNLIVLFTHAGIWTGTILTAAYLIGINVTIFDVVTLFIVHAVADYAKAKPMGFYKKLDSLKGGLLIDQLIHLLQLIVLLTYKGGF
jgi:predicted dehydrogenase